VKHINTYKIFENLRQGTEIISPEVAQEELKKLNHFNGSDDFITRGMKITDDPEKIFVIDPKLHTRISANTTNHYTLLIDNSERWKHYPNRSHSLICKGGSEYSSYGRTYRVVPLTNANLGICSQGDFWWSFPYLKSKGFFDMDDLNSFLEGQHISDDNIEDLYRDLDNRDWVSICGKGKSLLQKKVWSNNEKLKEGLAKLLRKGKTMREILDEWLDPVKNNFNLLDYTEYDNTFSGDYREVWTDAKCLLIPTDVFEIDGDNNINKKANQI